MRTRSARLRNRVGQVLIVVVLATLPITGCKMPATSAPITDSTRSLQERFDALRPGATLNLEPGTYYHSGVLKIRVPGVRVTGAGVILRATNDATSSVQVEADNVTLSGLTFAAALGGKRWTALDQHKLVLSGNGVVVDNVRIIGSAGAGIFVNGASGFTISRVDVADSRADGVHVTRGSHDGRITDVHTTRTGDDGVAVVSYADDPARSRNIVIRSIRVDGTRWGRGITVVGGINVAIRDFVVRDTDSAGIYVAAEGNPFFTNSVDAVTISRGSIFGANKNPKIIHGAVLVFSGNAGKHVNNVQISDISIVNTSISAKRVVGVVVSNGGTLSDVSFQNFSIRGGGLPPLSSNARSGTVTASGWTLDGRPLAVNTR